MTLRGILIVPLRKFSPEINGKILKIIWIKYVYSESLPRWKFATHLTLMSCFYYVQSIVFDPSKFNMMRGYIRAQEILTKNFFCVLNKEIMRSC
jgi:hypothetical protein